jgi:fatty acid synthase subunit beta
MIATRAVKLWKELDETIFSLPKDRRLQVLREKKNYIIQRLNADYQRVWFGKRLDGSVVDLEEMTYYEVAVRLLELMYVSSQQRWIDASYRRFFINYLRRVEERFTSEPKPSLLDSFSSTHYNNHPYTFNEQFFNTYSQAKGQLLTSDDIRYFLTECERGDQKPVPFVPILDERFDIYFKKDSLWGAEDLDAIPGQDVGRVCILQGPVAAKYSTKVNEPVKDILGNIEKEYITHLLTRNYRGDDKLVPLVEYIDATPIHQTLSSHQDLMTRFGIVRTTIPISSTPIITTITTAAGVNRTSSTHHRDTSEVHLIEIPENVVDSSIPKDVWFKYLAENRCSWFSALITAPYIVRDHHFYVNNIFQTLLQPRSCQKYILHYDKTQRLICLELFDRKHVSETNPVIKIWKEHDNNIITAQLFHKKTEDKIISLTLNYRYDPENRGLIHEIIEVSDYHYSIFNIQYSIFNIQYSIFNIQYSIFNIHYSLFIIHYSLFIIHYSFITHHSSLITHHSSLITHLFILLFLFIVEEDCVIWSVKLIYLFFFVLKLMI